MFSLRRRPRPVKPEVTDTIARLSRVEMSTEFWTTEGGEELPFGMEYEQGIRLLQYPRAQDPIIHAQDTGGERAVFSGRQGSRGVEHWRRFGQPAPAAQPTVMAWQRSPGGQPVFNLMQRKPRGRGCREMAQGCAMLLVMALAAAVFIALPIILW